MGQEIVWETDRARPLAVTTEHSVGVLGEWHLRVEHADEVAQLIHRPDPGKGVTQQGSHGKALQVPRRVPAKGVHSKRIAKMVNQQLGVADHDPAHLTEVGWVAGLSTGEDIGQVTEQPRPPHATSADHDTVAAGRFHHPNRVVCGPDITIA
jgi:hypothetical protein